MYPTKTEVDVMATTDPNKLRKLAAALGVGSLLVVGTAACDNTEDTAPAEDGVEAPAEDGGAEDGGVEEGGLEDGAEEDGTNDDLDGGLEDDGAEGGMDDGGAEGGMEDDATDQ